MEFRTTSALTVDERTQVIAIIEDCQRIDQLVDMPYLDNAFNYYPKMPAFVLCWLDNKIIGFASLYAAADLEANVIIYVLGAYRKRGVGYGLFKQAQLICREYKYEEIVVQTEGQRLKMAPWILDKFQLEHDYEMSEQLMIWQAKVDSSFPIGAITIRLADEGDLKKLAKIHARGFNDDYQQVYLDLKTSLAQKNLHLYVFIDNTQIIGSVTIEFATANRGYLFGYVIAKQFQGRGYGQQALAQVLKIVENKGIKQLNLAVSQTNEAAQHVYQKLGFIKRGTLEYLIGRL